jgi:hypothetical protein
MTKAETRRLKKGIELIELSLRELGEGGYDIRRDSFHHIFYTEDRFDDLFLAIIPIDRIEEITRTLLIIRSLSGHVDDVFSSPYGSIKKTILIDRLQEFLNYLKAALNTYGFTIFYSWQTDTSSNQNRNFIQDSLEKAIKGASEKSKLPLQLDKDTANREGSPDISHTILEKIDSCLLFVADISAAGQFDTNSNSRKKHLFPNSNVLYELGYAHGVLGENNIIMVFNEATGDVESLPFDLRGRRIMKYCLSEETPNDDRKKIKKELISHLESAILCVANANFI